VRIAPVRGGSRDAGPGAPHGAGPLEAASIGTRGCRGPAPWWPRRAA